MFNADTVTSYIVNGLKLLRTVEFSVDLTLTCTECEVTVAGVVTVSLGSIKCASNERKDVTLTEYPVMDSVLATGSVQETFNTVLDCASTSTFSGGLGNNSAKRNYHLCLMFNIQQQAI